MVLPIGGEDWGLAEREGRLAHRVFEDGEIYGLRLADDFAKKMYLSGVGETITAYNLDLLTQTFSSERTLTYHEFRHRFCGVLSKDATSDSPFFSSLAAPLNRLYVDNALHGSTLVMAMSLWSVQDGVDQEHLTIAPYVGEIRLKGPALKDCRDGFVGLEYRLSLNSK